MIDWTRLGLVKLDGQNRSDGMYFLYFLNHVYVVKVQELACSFSYSVNKTQKIKLIVKEKLSPIFSKAVEFSVRYQPTVSK